MDIFFDTKNKTDQDLVADCLQDDSEAFPILMNRYLKPIYRFVFGLVKEKTLADDLTQDIFIKVWKKLKKYKTAYSFKTWLFSVAHNTVIDSLRQRKNLVLSQFDDEEGNNSITDSLIDDTLLPEEVLVQAEEAQILSEALKKIPIVYREILLMHYSDDLSLREIADALKRPFETVKSQHRRGLLHLKQLLTRIR